MLHGDVIFCTRKRQKKKKYRENVTYDNLKSHEKPGFHPLSGK